MNELTNFENRPLFLAPGSMGRVDAIAADVRAAERAGVQASPPPYHLTPEGVAVIGIDGVLVHGYTPPLWRYFGIIGYDNLAEAFTAAMADDAARAVLFLIDSPGGEAAGMLDLSDLIYAARGAKPVWAFAAEDAYSAAYGIASAADRVYLTRTGGVGSVGVIAIHAEYSKALEAGGITVTPIRAGKHKAEHNAIEPLSGHARDTLQAEVDRLYGMFTSTVARNRGTSPEAIRATEAGIYYGETAIPAGLAEGIESRDTIITSIIQSIGDTDMPLFSFRNREAVTSTGPGQPRTYTEQDLFAAEADGLKSGRAEAAAIAEMATLAGCPERAASLIREGLTLAAARAKVLAERAAEGDRSEVYNLQPEAQAAAGPINPAEIYARRRVK